MSSDFTWCQTVNKTAEVFHAAITLCSSYLHAQPLYYTTLIKMSVTAFIDKTIRSTSLFAHPVHTEYVN